jgi:hypothetical protein
MGTVYLGRMISADSVQTVAIKVLHPHLANDSDMVSMFLDEAPRACATRTWSACSTWTCSTTS